MKRAPLQEVKSRFGSKADLIKQLAPLLRRQDGESETELRARLLRTPNRKLLHLYDVEQELRSRFKGREQLADAICKLRFADKKVDQDYRSKILNYSTARLLDRHRALSRH